jgi:hypothetical protein
LSLGAFAKALELLLGTYRRVASGLLTNALEDPTYGTGGGKYAKQAERLDFEIESVTDGSLGLSIQCTSHFPPGANLDLFSDLPLRAGQQLLEYIEAESKGQPRHVGTRKYLASLPRGVSGQRYRLFRDSVCEKEVAVGEVELLQLPEETPHLEMLRGFVVGVGFEPGKPEIRLKTIEPSRQITASASPEWVQKALDFRKVEADALVLVGERSKLLWLRPANQAWKQPSPEEREAFIFSKWDELLRRLAT